MVTERRIHGRPAPSLTNPECMQTRSSRPGPGSGRICAHRECELCHIGHGLIVVTGRFCAGCREWARTRIDARKESV